MKIINKILNKVKTYINSSKPNNNISSPEINKQKLERNKHGFPMYRPLVEEDKESNKRNYKY